MNFYTKQKSFYCGVDLHAKTSYLCLIDKDKKILMHREIKNIHTDLLLKILEPYKHDLVVAAESTFNWYWLADLCADNNIEFILGHAFYMRAIHGAKTKNDRLDSEKIARLEAGGMFPTAYVYPKQKRALRDLLRRRLHFVQCRAELFKHIQLVNYQCNHESLKKLSNNISIRPEIPKLFPDDDIKKSIDADLQAIAFYDEFIPKLEWHIFSKTEGLYKKELSILSSAKGIGKIIALTILFEMDCLDRFQTVQRFASYARVVKCQKTSANKIYGSGNPKIGNPYLKRAFSEAAVLMALHNPPIKKYLDKLERKFPKKKALIILSHKIARAVYYMLKNKTVFDIDKFLEKNQPSKQTQISPQVFNRVGASSISGEARLCSPLKTCGEI